MIVRYWQPFQEIDSLKNQIDQIFDDLSDVGIPTRNTWSPSVNLIEEKDSVTLQVQLPGVPKEAVDIQATRKTITISGTRETGKLSDGQRIVRNEFSYGNFRRIVALPTEVDQNNVSAHYANGILTIHLPKHVDELNRVVKVSIQQTEVADDQTNSPEA